MNAHDVDVAIVGGGLVGASLALALSDSGWSVAVLERAAFRNSGPPGYDDRTLALSLASENIFRAIGLWAELDGGLTPIRQVHVSQRGRPGSVKIRAADYQLEALGHVVEARAIGQAVVRMLPHAAGVQMLQPATVTALTQDDDQVRVRWKGDGEEGELTTRLLVGADGTGSAVRSMLGLAAQTENYDQVAIIANVSPQNDHEGRAFERLTNTGPLALLPHGPRRCGSVWVTDSASAQTLLGLDDNEYLDRLQQRFGYRLGKLQRLGARSHYPLSRLLVPEPVRGRSLLIGNAAHTIHPIAAQGFNLGLRDVATLAELLADARTSNSDPGCPALLQRYWRWRQQDVERTVSFTDGLMRLFAQPLPLIGVLRTLGLIGTQLIPPLRSALAQRTMGFGGRVPRLARAAAGQDS